MASAKAERRGRHRRAGAPEAQRATANARTKGGAFPGFLEPYPESIALAWKLSKKSAPYRTPFEGKRPQSAGMGTPRIRFDGDRFRLRSGKQVANHTFLVNRVVVVTN
jgi:hypothetical protein